MQREPEYDTLQMKLYLTKQMVKLLDSVSGDEVVNVRALEGLVMPASLMCVQQGCTAMQPKGALSMMAGPVETTLRRFK